MDVLTIKGPDIVWSNFKGIAEAYNNEGSRYFVIVVPEEHLDRARELGLNVKEIQDLREDGVAQILKIKIDPDKFMWDRWIYEDETITITPTPWTWQPAKDGVIYEGTMAVLTNVEKEN